MTMLLIALVAFVGTHFILSHPLRAPLVRGVGEGGFAGVYSLVAAATLGWAVWAWRGVPVQPLWTAPQAVWWLAVPVMIFAAILFVGSLATPSPALVGAGALAARPPRGVQTITRHPMMWAFAIWAAVHATVSGDARTVALCAAIGMLALVGARLQDGKKRGQLGEHWAAHEAATNFVPFARGLGNPGAIAIGGGTLLFVVATWLHPVAGGPDIWSMMR